MEKAKQKLIIPPGSIHVDQDFNHRAAISELSPFSDGYDIDKEREKLGDDVDKDLESASDYNALESFQFHELLLKHYIVRNHSRTRRNRRISGRSPASINLSKYDIYPSEKMFYQRIGHLQDDKKQADFVSLHTKQAVRMWNGVSDKEAGFRRWAGVRYGLALIGELSRMTQNGNPFAHAELLKFEQNLENVLQYFAEHNKTIEAQLNEYAQAGLHIGVFVNENPELVSVEVVSYGFQLLQALLAYDLFVRQMKTLTLKGLVANRAGNGIIYEAGSQLRKLLQNLYKVVTKLRAIRQISRDSLLNDTPSGLVTNLSAAVAEGVLDTIPLSVLRFDRLPKLITIINNYDENKLDKLCSIAISSGLTTTEEG